MEVILLEKIRKLGDLGACVSVKPGFGRNYLIPQAKAVSATDENRKRFETMRAELEAKEALLLENAQTRAKPLVGFLLKIAALASEEGKLYGSVGQHNIAEAFHAQGIEVLKSEVVLPGGPLHSVGEHEVSLQLHSDVNVPIKIEVIASK